jgi:hypothetical protein
MKKTLWILTVMALATTLIASSVWAAWVSTSVSSADRQTFVFNLPAWVDLIATDDVTLRLVTTSDWSAVDLSWNQITAVTVDANDEFAQVTNAGDTSGYIVLTDIVSNPADWWDISFTLTSALTDNVSYDVLYSDNQWNFGLSQINFGTSNQIILSANVEPVLRMLITSVWVSQAWWDLAQEFWTLSSSSITEIKFADIEVWTNALNWATVKAWSLNWGLSSAIASWKVTEDATNVLASWWAPVDHTWEIYQMTSVINDQADDISTASAKDWALTDENITKAGFQDW